MTCVKRKRKVHVVADDASVVSRAGSAVLSGLADMVGLTDALSGAMARTRSRRAGHDPGVVLRDLAVLCALWCHRHPLESRGIDGPSLQSHHRRPQLL